MDAHRRYERLGYVRGDELKAYDDTSSTVRFYYRKELEPELPEASEPTAGRDSTPRPEDRWQLLFHLGAAGGTVLQGATKP